MSIKPNLWTIPQPTAQVLAGLPDKISVLVARLRQIADTHHAVRFASSLAVEDMLITPRNAGFIATTWSNLPEFEGASF